MDIGKGFSSIEQVTGMYLKNQPVAPSKPPVNFEDVLKEKSAASQREKLKFSKHAGERLEDRDISLTEEQLRRLEEGTRKAEAKGINESLVLMDNMAFIVNIRNSTVITAMNQQDSIEKVYTNIDGAVII